MSYSEGSCNEFQSRMQLPHTWTNPELLLSASEQLDHLTGFQYLSPKDGLVITLFLSRQHLEEEGFQELVCNTTHQRVTSDIFFCADMLPVMVISAKDKLCHAFKTGIQTIPDYEYCL